MPNVTIYSSTVCPYCVRAKAIFKDMGVDFTEINIQTQPEKREEMLIKSNGARTVPQIFIDDFHVGGCDDLVALKNAGKLEGLLK